MIMSVRIDNHKYADCKVQTNTMLQEPGIDVLLQHLIDPS